MPNSKLMEDLSTLDLEIDPINNFKNWFKLASNHPEIAQASQMMLATVGPDAEDNSTGNRMQPSLRWVQMTNLSDDGSIIFTTNSNSRKGFEVSYNNRVSVNFSWFPISKLVYIDGTVSKLSAEESQHYFSSLPKDVQIGFVALDVRQSQPIDTVDKINEKVAHLKQSGVDQYDKPNTFSAFKIDIHRFDFIQLQKDKLDDRIAFTRKGFSNKWLNEIAVQEEECLRVPVNVGCHGEWFVERLGV